jgi:hypothetical protein
MSNVVEFPLPDRPITEQEIDRLHSKNFRDIEVGFATSMAWGRSRET